MQKQLCMDLANENKINRSQVYGGLPAEIRIYSERVADYVQILYHTALKMGLYQHDGKLSRERLPFVWESARLFDIGYAAIPDFLRGKEQPTAKEKKLLERHTIDGFTIVFGNLDEEEFFNLPDEEKLKISMGMDAAIGHHERWDGKGYPNHELGAGTPILGRMCAICNAYDKQTSGRLYPEGMPHEFACGEIIRESGFSFDPELIRAFRKAMPLFQKSLYYSIKSVFERTALE